VALGPALALWLFGGLVRFALARRARRATTKPRQEAAALVGLLLLLWLRLFLHHSLHDVGCFMVLALLLMMLMRCGKEKKRKPVSSYDRQKSCATFFVRYARNI
jgi:hypothetical protein